jgi:predicted RNA-binding protein with PUA-like domain
MKYWLVKSEPEAYSWARFLREGRTAWDGVRNYQARNNLKAMKKGDLVLFYHSVTEKRVVGMARVVREHYPDPSAAGDNRWLAVDLVPEQTLEKPVSLGKIKADERLHEIALLRQSRLSVLPLPPEAFDAILELGSRPDDGQTHKDRHEPA